MIEFKVGDVAEMNGALAEFLKYLSDCGADDDAVFDSRLVSCELITNVLRHFGGEACFSGAIRGDEVIITVCGTTPNGVIPAPGPLPSVFSEGGRGLYIINEVSGGNVVIDGGSVTVTLKLK